MPIYEFRCQGCGATNSVYYRTFDATPPSGCRYCSGKELKRIFSTFAYHKSEIDKMEQLDSKYYKMVDQAIAGSPNDSDPNYHLDKMVPFSAAKETGESYFKD